MYAILAVLFVWVVAAQCTWSWYAFERFAYNSSAPGLPFYLTAFTNRIEGVPDVYKGAGLQVGDRVMAVNGESLTGKRQLRRFEDGMRPGEMLRVDVDRPGPGGLMSRLRVPVKLRPSKQELFDWVFVIGLGVLFPLISLAVGFYVALARPMDPLAWITLGMLLTFTHIINSGLPSRVPSPLREMLLVYQPLTETWPAWLVFFGLLFPVGFPYLRKHKWPFWAAAVPVSCIALLEMLGNLLADGDLPDSVAVGNVFQRAFPYLIALYTAYITCFFYLLSSKKRRLPSNDAKRRMNVMITGTSFALVPLLPVVLSKGGFIPRLPPVLVGFGLLMLLFFPLTMGYVIVVQQAMDVRMVVRTGVQYAIASRGLKVLRGALIMVLIVVTARMVMDSTHQGEAALLAVAGTLLVVGMRRAMEHASSWIDRKFFREEYDSEVILTELSSSVSSIRDVGMLVETVARRIGASLHVNRIAVLLDRGGTFAPVYAMGFGSQPAITFQRSSATIRLLRQMGASPSKIHFEDPQSWVHGAPAIERSALELLGAEILLPVTLKSRILGLISVGPKRSEAPYSRRDLQLLGAVASQTGLALENAELTEDIRREVAQRERLDRELEIAREVQMRLFPQKLPEIHGVDVAAYCRPALGVGGDYYDFIRLPDGCLGIAIGDVSGKGIAAALMMASLQASLRGQTVKTCSDLAEMISLVNRLVFEASAANRYATFFYSQYDPATQLLRYVNAGHNPPMLFRQSPSGGGVIERLETGGTVLGLFDPITFQESTVKLERGDVLVAFTDGITEAMDAKEEEFSDERLAASVGQCSGRAASDIIKCAVDQVDAFVRGAPQHDDMTIVALRLG